MEASGLALKLSVGALWLYTSKLHLSPNDASLILGVDSQAIGSLLETFSQFFTPLKEQLNDSLTVGGCGMAWKLTKWRFALLDELTESFG